MSGNYDVAQICRNGHLINPCYTRLPEHNQKFCDKCGEETITKCDHCGHEIRGYYYVPSVASLPGRRVRSFCHNCGNPYPWTIKRQNAAQKWLKELDGISKKDRKILKETLPDIINTTPRTEFAIKRVEELLKKLANSPIARAIRQFIIDFGTEQVKKLLSP